jgi:hypothetical protein
MTSRLRIVVAGLIAQYPMGGVTWDYVQYVAGLAPYNPEQDGLSGDCRFNVKYLAEVMSSFGLGNKWSYRFFGGFGKAEWFGLSDQEREEVIDSADLLVNVSCMLASPWEYRQVSRMACVDTDPVFTQVKLARGQTDFRKQIDAHDVHFSYGERFSESGPATGHLWRPIRKPILLSEWSPDGPRRDVFTTVMNWTSFNDVFYNGQTYGQKDVEFERFLELPTIVEPTVLELAVASGKTRRVPRDLLIYKGWHVVDPAKVCHDMDSYRDYIQSSKAEWTIAKNGYVIGQAGWFSGRTACYLAAGRPVVVQDTGFAPVIPAGEGILIFQTVEEAAAGIREVEANYDQHAKAARDIAEEYFDSDKVLTRLVEEAMSNN